jgi:hypothetical protein
VPPAVGRAGELDGKARIDGGVVAVVGRQRVGAEQVRQELGVGDARDLRPDDRAGRLVELVAVQLGMRRLQPVDLEVVLAHEQGLQGGQ